MKIVSLFLVLLFEINNSLAVLPELLNNLKQSEIIAEFLNKHHTSIIEKQRYFDHYDFIIIGSGPAGCVLANRLTENKKWNVLLVEAGKVETFAQDIPVLAAYMQATAFNWGYWAEPQSGSCIGMNNQRCGYPRGKALGGTSVINYMIYNRGHRNDFDRWAAAGNYGWSWNDVLPYFLKSEKSSMTELNRTPYHNANGYLSVEHNRHRTVLAESFVKACKYLGQSEVDYNSGNQLGASFLQANTKNGMRHSAFRAFIQPIIDRPNLHIMINTRVTKILIDPSTKITYGIEFVRNRKRYRVMARKEVILSAGTFNSPQLLMLSGVGQKKDLQRIGVPLIQDLPVGKIMYDHATLIGLTWIVNTTGVSLNSDRASQPDNFLKFLRGDGILTVPGGVEALSFIKTRVSDYRGPDVPDIELIFIPGGYHSDQGSAIRTGMGISNKIYNSVYKELEDTSIDTFTINQMLFHPKSVGYIELKSSNPFHWPKFYHNFFQHPDDVETMLEGIKYALQLVKTPPFQKHGARLHSKPLPNCAHLHFGSDNYFRCMIRTLSSSLHHQVGTCKMGVASDRTAVVSPELKVHGIKKLRVADNSIIPEALTAHTAAASYMVGEKLSDSLKRDWS